MKKGLLTTLLILVFAVGAMAQDGGTGITGKGIKVGLNLANISGDDVPDEAKVSMGFAFGGFFTYSLSPSLAIQPELLYSMKGSKAEMGIVTEKFKFNYLEIPVLLKFSIPTEGNMTPFLFGGPAISLLMSAKYEVGDGTNNIEIDIKDDLKSMDFGLAFGAGVGVAMDEGILTIEGRYTLGMTVIDDTPNPEDVKNTNISFLLGYTF